MKKRRQSFRKKPFKWLTTLIVTTIINMAVIIGLVLVYNPASGIRNLYIGTAYSTGTHKHFASFLYNDADIYAALKEMVIVESGDMVNLDEIIISEEIPTEFVSESEREVLERNPGDIFKVVPISGSGWKGYMTVIYDPSRISLATAANFEKVGQKPTTIAKNSGALVAINSTGFADMGGMGMGGDAAGSIVQNGEIIYKNRRSNRWGGGLVGFTKEGKLILTKMSAADAITELGVYNSVEFGPFLLINGQPTKITSGVGGIQPRTFIGQRADGIVLFFVIDGRQAHSVGISFSAMITLLKKYEVVNAANMDGGASSTLVINGKLHNKPCAYSSDGQRGIPVMWIVK